MADKVPPANLGPQSDPYVRWVNQNIADTRLFIERFQTQQINDNKQQKSSMNLLQRGLTDLEGSIDTYLADATFDAAALVSGTINRPVSTSGNITGNNIVANGNLSTMGAVSGASGSFGGNVVAGGYGGNGDVNIGGNLIGGGVVRGAATRNYVVSSNYAGAWINADGTVGISPSSRRFKTDIEPWQTNIESLLELQAVMFRYTFAPDGDKQLGFIAEELVGLGFSEFCFYEEIDGEQVVQGINYDRISVALLVLAQLQDQKLSDMDARLSALEKRLAN